MILNSSWLMLIIVSTVLGFATQSYIKSTFRTWSQVPLRNGMTGAQVASSYAACASGVTALSTARAQILAGFCDVALVIGADTTPKGFLAPNADGFVKALAGHKTRVLVPKILEAQNF